ncbi:serine/threonine-protein kinase Chk2 [Orussus abietinus]|uniref:serine/threonine-protein kinase Chk2 n=1 Tax=Orussus abietinus TaxID=222816 RepID=UPI000626DE3D|nr:serine/threonine-protein kinase Chk2 [Orussus abietinus]XP_012275240.1 serine/threonine-protein kinase Chk2 [Orussus abietinus]
MANDDFLPLSLPDTQNADAVLTQSQDLVNSQELLYSWGRLFSNNDYFQTIEMSKGEYTLGRSPSCDIHVAQDSKLKWTSTVSKVHFRIIKESISDTNDMVVYLEDLSHNGTFVNKILVGQKKRVVLENNDMISITQAKFVVYIFMNIIGVNGSGLPPELRCKYAVSRTLGSGVCGEVKMVFMKIGGKRFAMKTISKTSLTMNGNRNSFNDPEKIMNEVRILKELKHPCIIRMEEIIDTPSNVYIVLELMEGGELFERILKKNGLSEKNAKLIFYQVVLAVDYLHTRGITHRDLKPENILLASDADVTLVKVTDFGLSKLIKAETLMRTFCGTPMYVAPEILITGGRGTYTKQVDVWSLGVILYCCLSGLVPFNVNNRRYSLQEQIIKGIYTFPQTRFHHVSPEAISLIKQMMTVDPMKRITTRQVLLHPWLRDKEMRETVRFLMTRQSDEENCSPALLPESTDGRINNVTTSLKRARVE